MILNDFRYVFEIIAMTQDITEKLKMEGKDPNFFYLKTSFKRFVVTNLKPLFKLFHPNTT